jgi:flagellar secretion chaperone FliS
MWNNGQDAYLETRVLTADPIELVNMLYQAGADAVREARRHLAEGRIAERSHEINKACEIVIELATSLDHERGGEISERLALLYDYMQRRLLEANMKQSDAPLADVLGLLTTLAEAWAGVRHVEVKPAAEIRQPEPAVESPKSEFAAPTEEIPWSPPASDNPWAPPAPEVGYGSQGYGSQTYSSHAWSL